MGRFKFLKKNLRVSITPGHAWLLTPALTLVITICPSTTFACLYFPSYKLVSDEFYLLKDIKESSLIVSGTLINTNYKSETEWYRTNSDREQDYFIYTISISHVYLGDYGENTLTIRLRNPKMRDSCSPYMGIHTGHDYLLYLNKVSGQQFELTTEPTYLQDSSGKLAAIEKVLRGEIDLDELYEFNFLTPLPENDQVAN